MVFLPRLPRQVFGRGLAWWRQREGALSLPRRLAGAAAIVALAALVFLPLLSKPDRFPAAGDPQAAARAIADAVASARWETSGSEVSYLDADLSGRNRGADPASFHVHPLYYLLSRFLPGGLALTLAALCLAAALGLGTERLARAMGLDRGAALLAGTIALLSGGILVGLASPASLGPASAAALTPLLCLAGRALGRRPTPARAALLALAIAVALTGGSLTATALALVLAAAGAAFLPQNVPDPTNEETRDSGAPWIPAPWIPVLWIVGAVALGGALGAYRALPLAAGNWDAFAGWGDIVSGPWWGSARGALQLPFYLGVITLVCLAGALAGVQTDPRAVPLLCATCGIAFLAPRAYLPFVGIPLALAGGLGAMQIARLVPARVPLAAILAAVLTVEALPYHRARISGIGEDEMASSAQWIRFLARNGADERTAVLGPDQSRFGPSFAAAGILRSAVGDAKDLAAVEDLRSLAYLSPYTIVSDLPDPKRRLPLAYVDRREGKYVYLNPGRLGPVYWTQRVEPLPRESGETIGGATALRIPRRDGAVALDASRAAVDPPGEGFGRVKTFRRRSNGFECRVDLPGEAVVVVTEPFLPSLRAWVDGRPVEIFPANGNQIGLRLPAGRHDIACSLRPPGLASGIALSALGAGVASLLLAAPVIALLARRNRRPSLRPAGPASARERERSSASAPEALREASPLR